MDEKFYENFYKLCIATGVMDQMKTMGYMEDARLFSAKGAEQIVKAKLTSPISWIDEYRELFNRKNTGRSGLTSDILTITKKMTRFQVQFGYTKDQIMKATRAYIEDGKKDPRFIQEADYFIFKKEGKNNEERSKLAAWCETDDEEEEQQLFTRDI